MAEVGTNSRRRGKLPTLGTILGKKLKNPCIFGVTRDAGGWQRNCQSLRQPEDAMLPSCRTLDGFAQESNEKAGVGVYALDAGSTLIVKTRHSRYRLTVVDGS